MGLKEAAIEAALAERKRVADQEAERRAQFKSRQDKVLQNAKTALDHTLGNALGDNWADRITYEQVYSLGGHDGVGVKEWPAEVLITVDGLDITCKCSWYHADKTDSVGSAWGQWWFELYNKRFINLLQLGEHLIAMGS
jgi:hypothetical protein